MEFQRDEISEKKTKINLLTGGHKRVAEVLTIEIQELAKEFGIEKLGFLTLTFEDEKPAFDIVEANKRFHSLCSNVILKRYTRALKVLERSPKGRIHFHLLVVMDQDIRTGFNFENAEKRRFTNANPYLRQEWDFWCQTVKKYGFGEVYELMPVKSTAEGIARYVGKYISKHIDQRHMEDKGARLVSYIGYRPGDRTACTKFSWNSTNAWLWRRKLEAFCKEFNQDVESLKAMFGPKWCYKLQTAILEMPIGSSVVYPTTDHAVKAGFLTPEQGQEIGEATNITSTYSGKPEREDYTEHFVRINPDWSVEPDYSEINTGKLNPENKKKLQVYAWAFKFQDRIDHFKPEYFGYYKNQVVEARQKWLRAKKLHNEKVKNEIL